MAGEKDGFSLEARHEVADALAEETYTNRLDAKLFDEEIEPRLLPEFFAGDKRWFKKPLGLDQELQAVYALDHLVDRSRLELALANQAKVHLGHLSTAALASEAFQTV